MDLDEKRREILASEGHLLIEGGPGCGKTTIALLKARRALESLEAEQRVLFLSFSRAAVRQVLDRAGGVLGKDERDRIEVRTFHSFFLDVLRSHGRMLHGKAVEFISPTRELQMKAEAGEKDWAVERRRLARVDGRYVFDLFAQSVADLFASSRAVRSLYSDSYPLILVDEFQDTNEDQWRVIWALAAESTVILLADPDQRIFDHIEGVVPDRIPRAVAHLKPREFDLSADNYRSPVGGILDYANAVLRNRPIDAASIAGVRLYNYGPEFSVETAAQIVTADLIKKLSDAGMRDATIAVLANTNGIVSRISSKFDTGLSTAVGELPAIAHDLHWDADRSAAAAVALATLLEWPSLDAVSATCLTLARVADFYRVKYAGGVIGARATVETVERAIARVQAGRPPVAKAAKTLLDIYTQGYVLRGSPVVDWARVRSLFSGSQELEEVGKAARFVKLSRPSDSLAWALGDVWDGQQAYLSASMTVQRALEEDVLQGRSEPPAAVTLMSMHKSKGREFDGVVLVEDRHRGPWLSPEATPEKIGESRRLLRVAITRARHRVYIVRPAGVAPLVG